MNRNKSILVFFLFFALLFCVACGLEQYRIDYPLHSAIYNNDRQKIQSMLAGGADINTPDKSGATPLHAAVCYQDEQSITVLLAAGAKINAQDKNGDTPLHNAVKCGAAETIVVLLKAGADINVPNNQGDTPILHAIKNYYLDMAIFVAGKGADTTVTDKGGNNLWHIAAEYLKDQTGEAGARDFFRTLKADTAAMNRDKKTPYVLAMEYGNLDIVAYLRHRGVKEYYKFTPSEDGVFKKLRGTTYIEPAVGSYKYTKQNEDLYHIAVVDCNHYAVPFKIENLRYTVPVVYGLAVAVDNINVPRRFARCMSKMGFEKIKEN